MRCMIGWHPHGDVYAVALYSCLWQPKLSLGYDYFSVNAPDEVSCRLTESRKFSFDAKHCPQLTLSLYLSKWETR